MPHKQSDAKPAEKLLALHVLLLFNCGRSFSLSELAARLECSKQTVLRLVDQLEASEYGKISRSKQGRESVYCIERPQRLPQIELNAEGLYQLAMCRNMLLHLLPKDILKQTNTTLRKAGAYANGPVAPDSVVIGQSYSKGRIDYTPFQDMLAAFVCAIQTKKVCMVRYRTRLHKEDSSFEFAPKRLIAYHETMLLLGWKVTEKGQAEALYDNPMPIYLHRCTEVALTRRSAGHLPEAEPAQNSEGVGLFGIMRGEPFNVTAHFAPAAATYVYERQWSKDQEMQVQPDASVILRFSAQSEAETLSWLLSFGERVTVLEPECLREEIKRQAAAIVDLYGMKILNNF